ncbi:MAG: carotenoid 1,2-hydratase, partial [Polaromonas sp.]|nr:carotenoid 1,2-hydratase [Polaromonas sp.]
MHRLPASMLRRQLVLAGLAGAAAWHQAALALPAKALIFPRDRGAHPDFRTEWWYITGQASTADSNARRFGFQLTFFRSRVEGTQAMTSKFAAKQLLFAHAAITDVAGKRLWHDQRIARAGFGVAEASDQDMAVTLRNWSLQAEGNRYTAELPAADFALAL